MREVVFILDYLFEEKAVDKIFRTGGVGSFQSRYCLVVKAMTDLTPKHPIPPPPPRFAD